MQRKIISFILFLLWASLLLAKGKEVRIVFCGDTNFAESYQENFARKGERNVLVDLGYDYSIEEVGVLTKRADLTIANLETVITSLRKSSYAGKKSYIHYSHVKKTPAALKRWGIDAVSLGNNHTMDFGLAGLKETVQVLKKCSIPCFGGGLTEKAACAPYFTKVTVGAQTFPLIVLGAFEYRARYQRKYSFYAKGPVGGVNGWTDESCVAQVKATRKKHPQAFIVAFPHWGSNYHWRNKEQKRRARAMIEGGANLIIGHGAHMLQEVEKYKGRYIVYSLGNFVFNTKGRYDKDKKPPYSLIAQLTFKAKGKGIGHSLRLYPTFCNNRKSYFRSRLATKGEMEPIKKLLLRLESKSSKLRRQLIIAEDELGPYIKCP